MWDVVALPHARTLDFHEVLFTLEHTTQPIARRSSLSARPPRLCVAVVESRGVDGDLWHTPLYRNLACPNAKAVVNYK